MQFLNDLYSKHGFFLLFVAWPCLSAVLNMVLRKKKPEDWVKFAEANPRLAGIIRFVRATGLDPVKGWTAFMEFIKGEAKRTHELLPPQAKAIEALVASSDEEKKTP